MANDFDFTTKVDPHWLRLYETHFSETAKCATQEEAVQLIQRLIQSADLNRQDTRSDQVSRVDVEDARIRLEPPVRAPILVKLAGSLGTLLLGGGISTLFTLPSSPPSNQTLIIIVTVSVIGAIFFALDIAFEFLQRASDRFRPSRRSFHPDSLTILAVSSSQVGEKTSSQGSIGQQEKGSSGTVKAGSRAAASSSFSDSLEVPTAQVASAAQPGRKLG